MSSLMKFIEEQGILAGFVMTCVGSVQRAKLRLANDETTGKNEARNYNSKLASVWPYNLAAAFCVN